MIQESTNHMLELLRIAVIVSGCVMFLMILYIFVIKPILKIKYRIDLAEREAKIEHQQFLQHKYNRKYNLESTKVGEEKQQLDEIKKEV